MWIIKFEKSCFLSPISHQLRWSQSCAELSSFWSSKLRSFFAPHAHSTTSDIQSTPERKLDSYTKCVVRTYIKFLDILSSSSVRGCGGGHKSAHTEHEKVYIKRAPNDSKRVATGAEIFSFRVYCNDVRFHGRKPF